MKRLITLFFLSILCFVVSTSQTSQQMRFKGDGVKQTFFSFSAASESAGVASSNNSRTLTYYERARTPYGTGDGIKVEVTSPDGDSILAGMWIRADKKLHFISQGRIVASVDIVGLKLNDNVSSNSPLLVLQSGNGVDSVYLQYTLSGDKLFVSKPILIANQYIANAVGAVWSNGDTLFFGTSTGKVGLVFNGGIVGDALVNVGNNIYAPQEVVGGGGGGSGDTTITWMLSDGSNITNDADTAAFDYLNFTKVNSAGKRVTIGLAQNIHPSARVVFDQARFTGDSLQLGTPNGSKTVTLATQNTGFNPLFLFPTAATGTFAVSATSPLALDASTGNISLSTVVPANLGGTGISTSPTAGGVAYGNGSTLAYTAAGTNGYMLISNGFAAPSWFNWLGTANTFSVGQTVNASGGGNGLTAGATSGYAVTASATTGRGVNTSATSGTALQAEAATGTAINARINGNDVFKVTASQILAFLEMITSKRFVIDGTSALNYPDLVFKTDTDSAGLKLDEDRGLFMFPFLRLKNDASTPLSGMGVVQSTDDSVFSWKINGQKKKLLDEGDVKYPYSYTGDSVLVYSPGLRSGDIVVPFWISTNVFGHLLWKVQAPDTLWLQSTNATETSGAQFGYVYAKKGR